MPRKRLTREERRALTRSEILDAAERIFPRRGYRLASVEEVAEEAGLTTGAVYSNFESKADLYLALNERLLERHAAELEEVVARGATPKAQIEEAGRAWLDFLRRDRDWLLLDVEFWSYAVRDPDLRDRYAAAYRRMRETTAGLVKQATEAFGLSLPASAEQLGLIINALSNGLVFEKLVDPDGVPDELFESALALILRSAQEAEVAELPAGQARPDLGS
jgi:AcrR family transcriptional regulator